MIRDIQIDEDYTVWTCTVCGKRPCVVAAPVIRYEIDEWLPVCPLEEVEKGVPCWKVIWPPEVPMSPEEIAEMEASE